MIFTNILDVELYAHRVSCTVQFGGVPLRHDLAFILDAAMGVYGLQVQQNRLFEVLFLMSHFVGNCVIITLINEVVVN